MTPEERAADLLKRGYAPCGRWDCPKMIPPRPCPCYDDLVAAIRQAEIAAHNAAVEAMRAPIQRARKQCSLAYEFSPGSYTASALAASVQADEATASFKLPDASTATG